ncbi:MAG: homogentisate 1,2-dioxygenase [Candidatus Marinimicrobia bacterium]|nr:homogentisate 1,2-dioxygenase [Candidatus Neomarinimicrobiota bacterium]
MPFYQKRGEVPPKRHTILENPNGGIYFEELISREGFSDIYSNIYHLRMPTKVVDIGEFVEQPIEELKGKHRNRHIRTNKIKLSGDAFLGRVPLFYNSDLTIYKAHINKSMDYHYRNGHHDELIYIQEGKGRFISNFGTLELSEGDYLIIPRGIIWKFEIKLNIKALVIESYAPIRTPKRYRNKHGQHLEHSPFCERDFIAPEFNEPVDDVSEKLVRVRLNNGYQDFIYAHNPFDVVGWDGYYFPWKFNINDFEPIVGSIHQPPPVHQTFESIGFVVCSFVSRLFDFHPKAIPAPYPHSNLDSDEIIFYSMGDFMSRKGIELESITLHPSGIPHGPQPGKYEESIGKTKTTELAVMIDTFKPLKLAKSIQSIDDKSYSKSWL